MGWIINTLTTAAATKNVAFAGGGSIYAEGTFGGGTLEIHPIADNTDGTMTTSTSSLYTIDGSTTVSADLPSGHYQLKLAGSTGATVKVFINDQLAVNIGH